MQKKISDNFVIANFMDSSLQDLEKKGVFETIGEIYNPNKQFKRVLHFTPHLKDRSVADRLSDYNIEIWTHDIGWLRPRRLLPEIWRLSKVFRQEKVSLVRGRLPYLGSLIGCLAARIVGIPSVVSLGGDNRIVQERNNSYAFNSIFVSYFIEWLVLKLAKAIIVPNQYTKRYVEKICGERTAKKCACIPWLSKPVLESVAQERLACQPAKAVSGLLNRNLPFILIVGFLNRYKYTDVLFDMLADFVDQDLSGDARPHFVFCGDGPLREDGENRFAMRSDIHFLGWTSQADIHALMREAKIVLVPMSGFVLLEASSIGKPVITSDVEWHQEIITNGKTGTVVEPTDRKAWASAIRDMIQNPEHAMQMGSELKKRYWDEYAPQFAIQKEADLYQSLVNRK